MPIMHEAQMSVPFRTRGSGSQRKSEVEVRVHVASSIVFSQYEFANAALRNNFLI